MFTLKRKQKNYFDFNRKNVSNECILEKIRHLEVIQKRDLVIFLVKGLSPIVILRGLDLCF